MEKATRGNMPIIGRDGLRTMIMKKAHEERKVMRERLDDFIRRGGKASLTTDSWTSEGGHCFISLTFHGLTEEMQMITATLALTPHQTSKTAPDHVAVLETQLDRWGLKFKDIVEFTTDTEATMQLMGRQVMDKHNCLQKLCFAHRVNLVMEEAIDENLPGAEDTLKAVDALAAFFHSSTQATHALKTLQMEANEPEPTGLSGYTKTRWWSRVIMGESVLKVRPYLDKGFANGVFKGGKYALTSTQWCYLEQIVKVLKPFGEAQRLLEGQNFVTKSLEPQMVQTLIDLLVAVIAEAQQKEDDAIVRTPHPCGILTTWAISPTSGDSSAPPGSSVHTPQTPTPTMLVHILSVFYDFLIGYSTCNTITPRSPTDNLHGWRGTG